MLISPHSWNVKTFWRSGRCQGVLWRGGRVGAGGHPHWTLQHIVKVSTRSTGGPGSDINTHHHGQGHYNENTWPGQLRIGQGLSKYVSWKSAMRQKRELAILVKDFCDGRRVTGEEGETYSVICCQSQCSLRSGIAEGIICFYCCLKWTT